MCGFGVWVAGFGLVGFGVWVVGFEWSFGGDGGGGGLYRRRGFDL